jgi:hypothetical protein
MPQKSQPPDQVAEALAGGCKDGVVGVAGAVGEIVAVHARLDSGAAPHLALDLRGDAALLFGRVNFELAFGRRVVAAISGIGVNVLDFVLPSIPQVREA